MKKNNFLLTLSMLILVNLNSVLAADNYKLHSYSDADSNAGLLVTAGMDGDAQSAQKAISTPYGGVDWAIPGTIEAENYDDGGEGIAYHDDAVAQQGASNGNFRPTEGVDVEKTADVSGGYNIGWTSSTEWLRYSVDVATAGSYKLEIRYATGVTDCAIDFSFVSGADNVTGSIPAPTTGGWGSFNWVNATVQLKAGPQVMIVNPGVNINYYTLTLIPPTNTSIPYTGKPWSIPGTIEAENYDAGGEGIAYHDDAVGQQGVSNGNFRPTEGVDVEKTADVSGGYNIGWTSSTEWLRYTVDVAKAGSYNLGIRYATGVADCSVGFSFVSDADNVSGSIPAPTTGGWGNFDWVNATVQLKAGPQVMIINPGVNINYYTLTPIIPTPVTVYTIKMDVDIKAIAAGVCFGETDPGNFFMWQLNIDGGSFLRTHVWNNGAPSLLEQTDISSLIVLQPNTIYALRIEINGDKATTYINDILVDKDRSNPRGGAFGYANLGFRASNASKEEAFYDNITVTNVVNSATSTLFSENFSNSIYAFDGGQLISGRLYTVGLTQDAFIWQIKLPDVSTSVQSLEGKTELLIYPNPVQNILNISTKPVDYQIFNLIGKEIKTGKGAIVDVADFTSGVYVIRVGSKVSKFVKY